MDNNRNFGCSLPKIDVNRHFRSLITSLGRVLKDLLLACFVQIFVGSWLMDRWLWFDRLFLRLNDF